MLQVEWKQSSEPRTGPFYNTQTVSTLFPSRLLRSFHQSQTGQNVPLGALLIQDARTALLATDGGALLERHAHRAVAARVPHDAAAAAVAVVVGGSGGEALGVGDLVLLAGRHFVFLGGSCL